MTQSSLRREVFFANTASFKAQTQTDCKYNNRQEHGASIF